MSDNLRIRDVCSRFSSGKTISASNVFNEGKYPVYGGNGLRGYTDTYNFDGECAIIGRQGAYCGNVKFFSGKGYMTEHAIVAVANQNNNSRFLAYKFTLMDLRRYAGQSAQPGLSVETLLDVEIDVPEKNAQDNIARVLSTIDAKIENNNDICTDLEAMAKMVYDYWFVQFDFPGEDGKPYKSSGGKMVWNEELKREIPEGWEAGKIESAVSLERGISYSTADLSGNGIPMINLGSISIGGGYKDGSLKSYSGEYTETKKVFPYDLILCLTQQTSIDPSKDVIGCAMLVPDIFDSDVVISQDLIKIVCDDALKYYLVQYFNTQYFHRYITGYASGSNILHLDINGVLRHLACFPPKVILKKYAELVKPMWEKRSEYMSENQQLASLRDFLLPMLMNGQIKVRGKGA